jgi:hypothetical protein
MLKNHIDKCHLDLIHIPCPALGKLFYFSIIFSSYYNLQAVFTQQLLLKVNILTF